MNGCGCVYWCGDDGCGCEWMGVWVNMGVDRYG